MSLRLALAVAAALAVGYTAGYLVATAGPLRGFIAFAVVASFAVGAVARLGCYLLDVARFALGGRR